MCPVSAGPVSCAYTYGYAYGFTEFMHMVAYGPYKRPK